MKVGEIIENTYTTSQIAKIIGIHPNTVRLYEELKLIPKPLRKENNYRIFTDLHIKQFQLVRTAFQIEVLQNGLRKSVIKIVKLSANKQYDKAIKLTHLYIQALRDEIENANKAVEIAKELMQGYSQINTVFLKRKEVSDALGITMDTLRNWEMNGLLHIKRKENGYRIYSNEDMKKLKIIKSLRCANYSLSSILRMMNALKQNSETNIKNAKQILIMLKDIKNKYANPPL